MPRRDPILVQGRLDAMRRRIARAFPGGAVADPFPASGANRSSFLRRMAIGSGRFRGGRLLAILGVGWMLYTLVAGQQGLLAIRELRAERDRLRAESTALGDEIAALETRLAETSDDPHRLERVAREVYGLARPGETVYRITPVSSSGSMP